MKLDFKVSINELFIYGNETKWGYMDSYGRVFLAVDELVKQELALSALHEEAKRRRFGPYKNYRELPPAPEGWEWSQDGSRNVLRSQDEDGEASVRFYILRGKLTGDLQYYNPSVEVLECLIAEYRGRKKES